MAQVYMTLKYEDYKSLEEQCQAFKQIETAHTSTDGYYHKSFRLALGDLLIEFQGPLVKEPYHEVQCTIYGGQGQGRCTKFLGHTDACFPELQNV